MILALLIGPAATHVGAWLRDAPGASQTILAASAGIEDNPLLFLLNFGALGIWVVCSVTGLQPTRGELRAKDAEISRLESRIEKLEAKDGEKDEAVAALVRLMTGRTLPALATAVAEAPQQAAPSETALGKLEALVARAERVLRDERST